jgi:hypothetical protein
MSEFLDKPEIEPYEIDLGGGARRLLDDRNAEIALFRKRPEMDYLAIKNEQGRLFLFDSQNVIDWFAGFALAKERQKQLLQTERSLGKFALAHGFNPDVVVQDYPLEWEVDLYVKHISGSTEQEWKNG